MKKKKRTYNSRPKTKYELIGFRCLKCHEIYIFKHSKEFIECSCGASHGDAGDGFYYRLGGQADALMTLINLEHAKTDTRTKK